MPLSVVHIKFQVGGFFALCVDVMQILLLSGNHLQKKEKKERKTGKERTGEKMYSSRVGVGMRLTGFPTQTELQVSERLTIANKRKTE